MDPLPSPTDAVDSGLRQHCGVYTYIRGDGPGAILFGDSAEEFQYMSHRLTDAERLLDFHILELMGVRKTVNWRPN